jgi:UDP-glucose 4-epimerase
MRRALVTGGAGFIGSNLCDRLESQGVEVVVYDDFSTGETRFIERLEESDRATIVKGDVLDSEQIASALRGCDVVFHLAANADVRHGLEHPARDLRQNTIGTFTVLEAMREVGVSRIVFASTGSIYGEPTIFPTPEDSPFPVQTSLYGASKLAAEGLIEAYAEGYGFDATILRFVSILGERYTHGHLFDFYRSLRDDPASLTVLGDGRQTKSYLYVGDCIEAMMLLMDRQSAPGIGIYNLGADETTTVDDSARAVCAHLGVSPKVTYTGGERGWVGDSPLIQLDCSRLKALGWRPTTTIPAAVERTLEWFDENLWVFDARREP